MYPSSTLIIINIMQDVTANKYWVIMKHFFKEIKKQQASKHRQKKTRETHPNPTSHLQQVLAVQGQLGGMGSISCTSLQI